MAEEDEVDVLGDYSFDLLHKSDTFDGTPLVSQNSDLLNCDYTVHPQWLLDKPSTNPALWYSTTSELEMGKHLDFDTQTDHYIVSQQNSITDESGWTEKEKDLLNRGIEIFGKSNVNLSQFIGSRTPAEVKYYLKNFYSEVPLGYASFNQNIVFDETFIEETPATIVSAGNARVLQDDEIPASIEEVIDAVSTASTTTVPRKRTTSTKRTDKEKDGKDVPIQISYNDVPCGQSLLKSNYTTKGTKVKFKTKLHIINKRSKVEKSQAKAKKKKKKKEAQENETKVKVLVKSMEREYKSELQIVTGAGKGVPVCEGEQVVKIIKENSENSDSDVDIDIEDNDMTFKRVPHAENFVVKQQQVQNREENNKSKLVKVEQYKNDKKCDKSEMKQMVPLPPVPAKKAPQLEELDEEVIKELLTLDEPTREVVLSRDGISQVEKFLFYEFFEDRPTKTPTRYLHIRNHILDRWSLSKPNYLRKTSIRNGLKQAGDVNLIGRIHSYLEQVAAINFGCEQTSYCRPLLDLAVVPGPPKDKIVAKPIEIVQQQRQRIKKKHLSDGEGGYTITHNEKGEIVNTTVFNEEPVAKQRTYVKKPAIRLIYCRPFTDNYQQICSISLDVSTLILLDLHAHMYMTEVMGLIGGYWNARTRELLIKRYIPCKNVASSLTHCDMCPISQAKAADLLHNENLDILGWYHSHPTFAPEPSQQDLDTQLSVQKWIGNRAPCIGFILSPFSLHGALIASPYRCMIVARGENSAEHEQLVPYKFKVDLLSARLDVELLLQNARGIIDMENVTPSIVKGRIDFQQCYFQDNTITHLDKFIYSVKMHLAKCSNLNKMTCDAIIEGLTNICRSCASKKS